jgi:hypothetical protein
MATGANLSLIRLRIKAKATLVFLEKRLSHYDLQVLATDPQRENQARHLQQQLLLALLPQFFNS